MNGDEDSITQGEWLKQFPAKDSPEENSWVEYISHTRQDLLEKAIRQSTDPLYYYSLRKARTDRDIRRSLDREDALKNAPKNAFQIDGAEFLEDHGRQTVPVWGHGDQVLWAKGEALMIAGGQGAGKTTIGQQVMLGRLGVGAYAKVLGLPVEPGDRKVLYLAMDRPNQAARSLQRMVEANGINKKLLRERLVVWPGPPLGDMAQTPELLLEMCREAKADTVVVDSLKDAAIGLSDDAVGAAYNRARQLALADGVEVLELQHNRKRQQSAKRSLNIDDIYGSTWLTSGAGSVILLKGEPGDMVVQMFHVKQPEDQVGPWQLIHDHSAGRTDVYEGTDLVQFATISEEGITAVEAACALFGTDQPTPNEKKKAERKLGQLVKIGELEVVQQGDAATKTPTRWGAAK